MLDKLRQKIAENQPLSLISKIKLRPYKHKNSNTIYLFISFSFPSLSISSENDQTRLFIIPTKKFISLKYAFSASKYHKQ